ncbi:MAG TPA: triphosphoribosyl-dephospho-CoA synthase [Acetobacteraceae bacterium]|nr:triphosphoribosyl-dephospho-CoA synthase [Acetobacteraceae bacterium]
MTRQALIEAAFRTACADELAVPKPGNVHRYAAGHRMGVADFLRSADAAAPVLCRHGAALGARVLDAVAATRAVVGQNTNLGIILLCAPLVMAAERPGPDLQAALRDVLNEADLADADAMYRAIRLAAPAGLGQVPRHDVAAPATVTLAVAMAEAAQRDSVARQWTTGFADVFGPGLQAYLDARSRWPDPAWAPLAAYLRFLAAMPDSHVLRKHGAAAAERVRRQAIPVAERLLAAADPVAYVADLLAWDRALKARGVNPGTSADLTVATILVWRLHLLAAPTAE